MNRIHLLSDEVASQVAAGEVVERPASVVKELVENAIDAGAKQIEVLVRRGGISLIRVVDDGCGMNRDDALLSLERHATSKIRTGADLAALHTLGFRGEALPSIASVSRFRLCTREQSGGETAEVGTEIQITGGKIDHVRDAGEAPGTQIEVRSLFFNLPARRKFLRTENTEMSHVEHQLALQAIGHPEIGFVFRTDQRLVFQIPATTSLHQRIRDLWGASLADELLEVPPMERDGVRVHGYVGRAGVSRSTRTQQLTFVNGRAVENSVLTHALREGYHTSLMKGQSPITFLFIGLDPEAVDVNVHPAKREVRFREPSRVREAVVEAVRNALESDRERWSATFAAPDHPAPAEEPVELPATQTALPLPIESVVIHDRHQGFKAEPSAPASPASLPEVRPTDGWMVTPEPPRAIPLGEHPPERYTPGALRVSAPLSQATFTDSAPASSSASPARSFRLLGVLGSLYVLMENEGGLVLVDQHAAHERILFEQLQHRMEEQGVPVQRLLVPVTLELGTRDSDWVSQNLATLQKMGIGMEPFGADTWKLDSLPQFVRLGDPLRLLREVIDELRTVSNSTSKLRLGEDVIAKTVCRAAVKANDILREPELIRLIEDLLRCDLPYCCPHGRPTMIQISYSELEKKFGRKA